MPVAVSVPATLDITVSMVEENWAFGQIKGVPRGEGAE